MHPASNRPRFAAAVSKRDDSVSAIREAAEQALAGLGAAPHLALIFASPHHLSQFAAMADRLAQQVNGAATIGCSGESILCNGEELEDQGAVAMWLAHLPGVAVRPMHLEFSANREGGSFRGWPEDASLPDVSGLIMLADPFSFPADVFIARLNEDRPGTTVVGGMASGGWQPGQTRLMLGGDELASGAVAVLLDGAVRMRTVVSQGCRPIGRPFVVTRCERNAILELGGQNALAQLQQLYSELSPEEQRLAQQGLHVGQVINEYQDHFGRGDFLIRNVQGVDRESGAVVIGDYVRVGQTVQFHVRDAGTADEDLRDLLAGDGANASGCEGALVFTCNGRGTRLFAEPHHDARSLQSQWPGVPAAGFFAQGEIGPIGGKSFLHGFTASIALFGAERGQ